MLERFVNRVDFTSYEDFHENFRLIVPENFNFAYDVVDEYARTEPDKLAMVWCDEKGAEATLTFADMKRKSDQMANFLQSVGIGKGDPVMMILKRRYEFWVTIQIGRASCRERV